MLSTAASNTLLKTLEEPPAHVVFVLATTDPQKVLPTIISRVQHFQFHLLGADTLGSLVRSVNADAGLGLDDGSLDKVVRRGAGSARDALSVLDQAAALGSAEDEVPVAAEVLAALVERDPARALGAVAAACSAGRDPRRLAEEVLAALRDAFLAGRAPSLVDLPADEVERVADVGRALGPAALVRSMETIGAALTEMREALDPRVALEVALVRVTAPEADASPAALLERIERLERRLAGGDLPAVGDATGPGPGRVAGALADVAGAALGGAAAVAGAISDKLAESPAPPAPPGGAPEVVDAGPSAAASADVAEAGPAVDPSAATPPGPPAAPGAPSIAASRPGPHNLPTIPPARPQAPRTAKATPQPVQPPPPPPGSGRGALGSYRGGARPAPPSEPAPETTTTAPASPAAPPPTSGAEAPSRDELTKAWGDTVLGTLKGRARALFAAGRFVGVEGDLAVFALPDPMHRDRCEPVKADVEAALAAHFGRRVALKLVADVRPSVDDAPGRDDTDDSVSYEQIAELRDAPPVAGATPAERIKSAFPGAEEVQP